MGGGGGGGYHHSVQLEDGKNRGDEIVIIPLHRGRGGRRHGSSTNIVNKADEDDYDKIGYILLDLAILEYHQQLQRQPRRQWLSWLVSSAAEVSCGDTGATPKISNCTAACQN